MDHDAAPAVHAANPAQTPQAANLADARRVSLPIVLVGMMGVGKTTVGRKLASLLERRFIDADEAIVEAAQLSIADIFERYGEDYFRDGERRVIARLIGERHGVIATGGGAFVDPQTRALILASTIAVFIDCDVATLVERTSRRNNRPLLQAGNPAEILERLRAQREPLYAEAPIRVSSGSGPQHDTALQIIEALDRWL